MMAPRVMAAALGLLAFSVSVLAGLMVHNPSSVILARALWAMFAFALIGLVAGWVAKVVIREHMAEREKTLLGSEESSPQTGEEADEQKTFTRDGPQPMGT